MKKHIVVDNEIRQFLIKTFGCTRMSVWRALSYDSNTDTARRIRKLALQKGGKLVGEYIPDCDTTHEEVEETMTQHYSNRVKLVLYKPTNEVTVYVDGKVDRKETTESIPEFMNLQKEVELMAASL